MKDTPVLPFTCYNMAMKHNKIEFSQQLLEWYNSNARVLPWRSSASAYHVWISEIMLQQTRVEAVIPFYERFIETLPTMKDLAEVSDEKLVKLWEGLGYYRRVHNMKKCAQICVQKHNGELPDSYEALLTLPGIGPYSAGAIASIAYRECVPAIDGNVLRVFSRVLICEDDILKESTKKKFRDIVLEYIPKEYPDIFNQAIMEVGALICIPNGAPKCDVCPIKSNCKGQQSGDALRLPNKTSKKARRLEDKTVVLLVQEDNVVLKKRASEGLLANMYEFLTLDGKLSKEEVVELIEERYTPTSINLLQETKHIFSHVEWHMIGYMVEVAKFNKDDLIANVQDIQDIYAIPTAFKVYREAMMKRWKK